MLVPTVKALCGQNHSFKLHREVGVGDPSASVRFSSMLGVEWLFPLKNRCPCWLAFRLETRNTYLWNPRITLGRWHRGEILTWGGVCGHESSSMYMDTAALSPPSLLPPPLISVPSLDCSDGHFLQETFPDHLQDRQVPSVTCFQKDGALF